MGCACTRLPRSADWSCLDGEPPDPEQARREGQSLARRRCRRTGLAWDIGWTMDRSLEPYAAIAAESLDSLVRLADAGEVVASDTELGHAAERCGRADLVVERLGRVLCREGTASEHRYAWIRACRASGQWQDLVRFLDQAIADPRHEAFDLESWILARAEVGRLDGEVLDRLRGELPRYAPRLTRANLPLPIHSTGEPTAFCAFAPLLLRLDPEGGVTFLREAALRHDLSLQLPFAWAFLARAQGLDECAAVELVLERARHLTFFAAQPWEAGWQPLFFRLWPAALHESAAEVLVLAGARSTAAVLRHAMEAAERLVTG